MAILKVDLLKNYLAIFDAVAHPIVVTDTQGSIVFVNSEFENMTNLSREIIRLANLDNIFPKEHKRTLSSALSLACQDGSKYIMRERNLEIRRKSRRKISVDVHMTKIQVDHKDLLIFSFSQKDQKGKIAS